MITPSPHIPPWPCALPNIPPTMNAKIWMVVVHLEQIAATLSPRPNPSLFLMGHLSASQEIPIVQKKQTECIQHHPWCGKQVHCAGTGGRMPMWCMPMWAQSNTLNLILKYFCTKAYIQSWAVDVTRTATTQKNCHKHRNHVCRADCPSRCKDSMNPSNLTHGQPGRGVGRDNRSKRYGSNPEKIVDIKIFLSTSLSFTKSISHQGQWSPTWHPLSPVGAHIIQID